MNLVLFEPAELHAPLPRHDARVRHVLEILRREPAGSFDAGIVDGPRGRARLTPLDAENFLVEFSPTHPPAPLAPIILIIGLPRPQTARDVLREATTLGVSTLHFVRTDKGDPNYARSTLWTGGEWRRHVLAGAEQAFATRLPVVEHGHTLRETLDALPRDGLRCALDNYEAPAALSATPCTPAPVTLALGAERGWSAEERASLRAQGFVFAHLGERVLRTETACIAAITLVKASLGLT